MALQVRKVKEIANRVTYGRISERATPVSVRVRLGGVSMKAGNAGEFCLCNLGKSVAVRSPT